MNKSNTVKSGIKHIELTEEQFRDDTEWALMDWANVEKRVFKLQKRIYRASQSGEVRKVRFLQKTLMRSYSAKLLAVRKVTQDNKGKKTAGVDGVKAIPQYQRLRLARELKPSGKAKPTRRVWIPKPGKEEKRPLGIPTIADRAVQALVKLVLEPQWEAVFEPNSYGFRPGRSCHDAIEAIFLTIKQKSKYVLDADIAQCFDKIDHDKLLEKINTYPTLRRQIKAWLRAGVISDNNLEETNYGTPQGGVISPLLANIALHGMEIVVKQYATTLKGRKTANQYALSLIRYADDFVVIHESIDVIKAVKTILEDWLRDLGLELKPSKTRISHTLNDYEGNTGFDFLGFNVRQYPIGKNQSGKNTQGNKLGFKTLIKPSNEKVKVHSGKLKEVIREHKSKPQMAVINKLNPIIRGWSNYYATVVSKETFSTLSNLTYLKLKKWAERRHPNKSKTWVANRYWHSEKDRNWVFADKQSGQIKVKLYNHADTPIVRHIKVKGEASPYNGDWVYWSERMGKSHEISERVAKLIKMQKGKCPICKLNFSTEDTLEIDHIIPRSLGGKNEYRNLQLLHRHCHDVKTSKDGSYQSKKDVPNDKVQSGEEPCEVKVSSTVLKTSGNREVIA